MGRKNVIIDEKILQQAQRVLKERTASATISKALDMVVKQASFDRWVERMQKSDPWLPGYPEEVLSEEALELYRLAPEEMMERIRNSKGYKELHARPAVLERKRARAHGRRSR